MIVKKSRRRRPELETLEAVTLLSTFAHAEARHVPVPVTPPVVALHGTIHASGKVSGSEVLTASGSGNLGAVGSTSLRVTASLVSPPSTITLSAKRGKLVLAEDSPLLIAGGAGSTTYHVAGGTGPYAHATGSGTVAASYSLLKGNRVALTINFS